MPIKTKLDYWLHKYFGINKELQKVTIKEPAKILEIGAGVGITSNFIAEKFKSSELIATDYDDILIKSASKLRHPVNVKMQTEDASRLSLMDDSFDVCFAILVFHHIPDFNQAMKEIYRVLKPGGKLFIYDFPFKTINPILGWIICHDKKVLFTKAEFVEALKHNNFKISKSEGNFRFWIEAEKSNE